MKTESKFITTHEAAQRSGAHISTIKRWAARRISNSGSEEPIKVDQLVTGGFRYLIDSDFFEQHFKPAGQRQSRKPVQGEPIDKLHEQLAEKDKLVEQQQTLIKQQHDIIEVLTARLRSTEADPGGR